MYGMEYIIQCETLHFGLGFISAFLVGFVLLRWMLTTYLWGCTDKRIWLLSWLLLFSVCGLVSAFGHWFEDITRSWF